MSFALVLLHSNSDSAATLSPKNHTLQTFPFLTTARAPRVTFKHKVCFGWDASFVYVLIILLQITIISPVVLASIAFERCEH